MQKIIRIQWVQAIPMDFEITPPIQWVQVVPLWDTEDWDFPDVTKTITMDRASQTSTAVIPSTEVELVEGDSLPNCDQVDESVPEECGQIAAGLSVTHEDCLEDGGAIDAYACGNPVCGLQEAGFHEIEEDCETVDSNWREGFSNWDVTEIDPILSMIFPSMVLVDEIIDFLDPKSLDELIRGCHENLFKDSLTCKHALQ